MNSLSGLLVVSPLIYFVADRLWAMIPLRWLVAVRYLRVQLSHNEPIVAHQEWSDFQVMGLGIPCWLENRD